MAETSRSDANPGGDPPIDPTRPGVGPSGRKKKSAARQDLTLEIAGYALRREQFREAVKSYNLREFNPQMPAAGMTALEAPEGMIAVYLDHFSFGNLRIPVTRFIHDFLTLHKLHITQCHPMAMAKAREFEYICHCLRIEPTVERLMAYYTWRFRQGWFNMVVRPRSPYIAPDRLQSLREWKYEFFFISARAIPVNVEFSVEKLPDYKPDSYETEQWFIEIGKNALTLGPLWEATMLIVGMSRQWVHKERLPVMRVNNKEVTDRKHLLTLGLSSSGTQTLITTHELRSNEVHPLDLHAENFVYPAATEAGASGNAEVPVDDVAETEAEEGNQEEPVQVDIDVTTGHQDVVLTPLTSPKDIHASTPDPLTGQKRGRDNASFSSPPAKRPLVELIVGEDEFNLDNLFGEETNVESSNLSKGDASAPADTSSPTETQPSVVVPTVEATGEDSNRKEKEVLETEKEVAEETGGSKSPLKPFSSSSPITSTQENLEIFASDDSAMHKGDPSVALQKTVTSPLPPPPPPHSPLKGSVTNPSGSGYAEAHPVYTRSDIHTPGWKLTRGSTLSTVEECQDFLLHSSPRGAYDFVNRMSEDELTDQLLTNHVQQGVRLERAIRELKRLRAGSSQDSDARHKLADAQKEIKTLRWKLSSSEEAVQKLKLEKDAEAESHKKYLLERNVLQAEATRKTNEEIRSLGEKVALANEKADKAIDDAAELRKENHELRDKAAQDTSSIRKLTNEVAEHQGAYAQLLLTHDEEVKGLKESLAKESELRAKAEEERSNALSARDWLLSHGLLQATSLVLGEPSRAAALVNLLRSSRRDGMRAGLEDARKLVVKNVDLSQHPLMKEETKVALTAATQAWENFEDPTVAVLKGFVGDTDAFDRVKEFLENSRGGSGPSNA